MQPISKEQLNEVIGFHLDNFNDENATIADDLKLSAVLSQTDGFGQSNSAEIFKNVIGWTFWRAGHPEPQWPDNWLELTIDELSTKLLNL